MYKPWLEYVEGSFGCDFHRIFLDIPKNPNKILPSELITVCLIQLREPDIAAA
jgi:hypothetical protein